MEVTIIESQVFNKHTNELLSCVERKFYPKTIHELKSCTRGHRAEKIKLSIEFTREDIPELFEFLQTSQPCFKEIHVNHETINRQNSNYKSY